MRLQNTPDSYGLIAKTLHWGLAAALWGMFLFGRHIARMKPALDNIHLYGWHKSIGILLLGLILFRLLWFIFSPLPKITVAGKRPKIKMYMAHSVHIGLYILMIVVPLSGWLANSTTGFELRFFGLFHVPSLIPENPTLEKWLFNVHKISANLLVALSVLHLTAAFYHHLIDKDDTLRRMLR
jgi:cytochrome b561